MCRERAALKRKRSSRVWLQDEENGFNYFPHNNPSLRNGIVTLFGGTSLYLMPLLFLSAETSTDEWQHREGLMYERLYCGDASW